ncbi:twitching motility protein [Clostridium polyendosporum]|uniref:Twitching motility protein n=1 Tax=Clostridium polyendosporum TaxID=69208 RepID=A0A919RWZ1_9CLOT|nr:type IV pilus twitching motility protein PilT [Clostridium polyendosporum]GIM27906.1 twitching motility protein [Clostridium polyendosporum]
MVTIKKLLETTIEQGASDLHLTVGIPPVIRVNGSLVRIGDDKLLASDTERYAKEILESNFDIYDTTGEFDTSYSIAGIGRFIVNVFKQRNSHAIAIRVISLKVPTLSELGHPPILKDLALKKRGLILVTGHAGSGKSTTLAAIINEINQNKEAHIITLEDPIEFLHKHNKCIVNQREIGKDSMSYQNALRAILREDPDVILIGEMRDLETISIAITAAETGHLVLSTLHTIGAAKTIDRIVDVFPSHQQQQIRMQLSSVLQGIVSQQLLPTVDNSRTSALEIMINTPAIQSLIREGKTYQIESSVQTGGKYGMKTMDMALAELCRKGVITEETAVSHSVDKDLLTRLITM